MNDATRVRLVQEADLRSRVNEKLLKALIGLLAVKDEHLLEELCVVFDHARRHEGVGAVSPAVWQGVDRQIGNLLGLGSDESPCEDEPDHLKH
jgi:hypothetical protein